jgi:hypothetical protein
MSATYAVLGACFALAPVEGTPFCASPDGLLAKADKGNPSPARRRLPCDGRGMRLHNGAAVEPDAGGCCVRLKGADDTFSLCMTEPTISGLIVIHETGEFAWSFTCDRHTAVLDPLRALTAR